MTAAEKEFYRLLARLADEGLFNGHPDACAQIIGAFESALASRPSDPKPTGWAELIEGKRASLSRSQFVEWLLSSEGLDTAIPYNSWLKALTHAGGLGEAKRRGLALQRKTAAPAPVGTEAASNSNRIG